MKRYRTISHAVTIELIETVQLYFCVALTMIAGMLLIKEASQNDRGIIVAIS